MISITPFLWFNDQAEEAGTFYTTLFKNSKITSIMPGPGGKAMGVSFELEGQKMIGLNGGPQYAFTEAISMYVSCETQEEVDYLWDALTADGAESKCGWLKDKFGLSWQIIPTALTRLMSDADRTKANRAVQAMLGMNKIVIAELESAFEGK